MKTKTADGSSFIVIKKRVSFDDAFSGNRSLFGITVLYILKLRYIFLLTNES